MTDNIENSVDPVTPAPAEAVISVPDNGELAQPEIQPTDDVIPAEAGIQPDPLTSDINKKPKKLKQKSHPLSTLLVIIMFALLMIETVVLFLVWSYFHSGVKCEKIEAPTEVAEPADPAKLKLVTSAKIDKSFILDYVKTKNILQDMDLSMNDNIVITKKINVVFFKTEAKVVLKPTVTTDGNILLKITDSSVSGMNVDVMKFVDLQSMLPEYFTYDKSAGTILIEFSKMRLTNDFVPQAKTFDLAANNLEFQIYSFI